MNEVVATKPNNGKAPEAPRCSMTSTIGFLLCRVIVPSWLLAGAIFKLAELNPNLLPPPVLWTSSQIGSALGQDPVLWLGFSMRFIIGTELVLVGLMYFVPRVARAVATAVLALFVVILVLVLVQGYDAQKGITSLFSGKCGCFGSAGPPPVYMLLIDGLLLIGVLVFRPARCGAGARVAPLAAALSILIGYTIAFIVPEQKAANPSGGENSGQVQGATDTNGTAVTQTDSQGWPLPPSQLQGFYYPQFKDWPGKKLSSIPFMHLLPRPLPEGFNTGTWLLVFYRADCDHCQELFLTYFSDTELPVPTLAVGIPDYQPEAALEFLCDACSVTELPSNTEYLVQTPAVVRVKDGVVTCTADGSNDDAKIEECILGTTSQ